MSVVGQQVGEYEIIERLGRGGMGTVYKARQISLNRFVALKTLQSSLTEDAGYIARFRQEARVAAGLNHPNLVQVYSAGENDGLHWFAMEYVEGESAKVRLKRKGRLDPLEAIAIAIHVAAALDYAVCKAALIHRDIKPDNIFLSGDGEVKLGDLGLAKSVGQAQGLTMTGITMGTPHYMSPEQVSARKDVDLRADIYGLGCTLYHLLCGQPPYAGNSAVTVMMKHVSAPVPDLRDAWPECPAELAASVAKMMQKLPAERPQNYDEVVAALRRAHEVLRNAGVSSSVTKTGQPEDGAKPVAAARTRVAPMAWVIGASLGCLAVIALVFAAPWKKGSTSPGETRVVVPQGSAGESGKKMSSAEAPQDARAAPVGNEKLVMATTPQPVAKPVPALSAPTPQPPELSKPASSTPSPSTPSPPATPKPPTEMEKWFAQVDGPQEETFQKQVLKPFETGMADLRTRYLASLDAAIARASAADQLTEALTFRKERESFAKLQFLTLDDADTPPSVKTLRTNFRQQLAALEDERTTRARTLLVPYNAILAQAQARLTQSQRLDDALLIKTRREEIALAWLGSAPLTTVGAAGHAESAKSRQMLPASKDQPFVNTLGMKFVPVPIAGGPTDGQQVLFCVWVTRVEDYETFVHDTQSVWSKADFPQGPTHPAVMVSWEEAQLFCQWLTVREQASRHLPMGFAYRLPTDHEWSCAAELGAREDATKLPTENSGKIDDVFPWGTPWPPPPGAGNYCGEETKPAVVAGKYTFNGVLNGYQDDFVETAPVGSFSPNQFGLYDMGGNVWQWCEDWFDAAKKERTVRGASWRFFVRGHLLSSYRNRAAPGARSDSRGFRCVLAVAAR